MRFKDGVTREGLHPLLVDMLEEAEYLYHGVFTITSAKRAGSEKNFHVRGEAVDIRCHKSVDRMAMVRALFVAGFCFMILYDLHIHVDMRRKHSLVLGGKSK